MSTDQYLEELHQAILRYIQEATDLYSAARNKEEFYAQVSIKAKIDIDRYGENLIPAGLTVIKLGLHNIAPSMLMNSAGHDERLRMFTLIAQIEKAVQMMTALVLAFGERGVWKLIEILDFEEEDLATLAVSCFNEKLINHPQAIPKLKEAFQRAEGTAYKMNLALFVRIYADDKFAESFFKNLGVDTVTQISEMVYIGIATDGEAFKNNPFWKKNRH